MDSLADSVFSLPFLVFLGWKQSVSETPCSWALSLRCLNSPRRNLPLACPLEKNKSHVPHPPPNCMQVQKKFKELVWKTGATVRKLHICLHPRACFPNCCVLFCTASQWNKCTGSPINHILMKLFLFAKYSNDDVDSVCNLLYTFPLKHYRAESVHSYRILPSFLHNYSLRTLRNCSIFLGLLSKELRLETSLGGSKLCCLWKEKANNRSLCMFYFMSHFSRV